MGLAKVMMEMTITQARECYGAVAIKLAAQAYLERFYTSLGFEVVGEPYLEDDIPHLAMIRPADV